MTQATTSLLSVAEVASRLQVHEATVYRLIDAGDLRAEEMFTNLGRRKALRVREADLASFIRARKGVA